MVTRDGRHFKLLLCRNSDDRDRPGNSRSGQMIQQDAANLPQCGRALLRAVVTRKDGFGRSTIQVGTPERDDQVSGGVAGKLKGDRVVRHPRRYRRRPTAKSSGLSTRSSPIALVDAAPKFSSLITPGPFNASSSATIAAPSAGGRIRPP